MGAGDVASQLVVERRSLREFEYKRTLRFACIGSFLVGPGYVNQIKYKYALLVNIEHEY